MKIKKAACDLCKKHIDIVVSGYGKNQKLCLKCFIIKYPVIKSLAVFVN